MRGKVVYKTYVSRPTRLPAGCPGAGEPLRGEGCPALAPGFMAFSCFSCMSCRAWLSCRPFRWQRGACGSCSEHVPCRRGARSSRAACSPACGLAGRRKKKLPRFVIRAASAPSRCLSFLYMRGFILPGGLPQTDKRLRKCHIQYTCRD